MICKGTTRIVYLIGNWAIKFPRIYKWKIFLRGLLSNIDESYWYKNSPTSWKEKLCPVIFKFPGGLFIIMKRATELPSNEYDKKKFAIEFKMLPLDNKQINFGKIDDKIVLLDYADSPYLCSDCSYIIKQFN